MTVLYMNQHIVVECNRCQTQVEVDTPDTTLALNKAFELGWQVAHHPTKGEGILCPVCCHACKDNQCCS